MPVPEKLTMPPIPATPFPLFDSSVISDNGSFSQTCPLKFRTAFLPSPRLPLLITLENIEAESPVKKMLAEGGTKNPVCANACILHSNAKRKRMVCCLAICSMKCLYFLTENRYIKRCVRHIGSDIG